MFILYVGGGLVWGWSMTPTWTILKRQRVWGEGFVSDAPPPHLTGKRRRESILFGACRLFLASIFSV